MSVRDQRDLPVPRVSQAVRDAVVADSEQRGVSMNDVVVGILAAHYRIPFEGTGRRSPGTKGSTTIPPLRLPTELYRRIHEDAWDRTKAEVVESILRDHYGLEPAAV